MGLVNRVLALGSSKDDELQRVRLTRQVNGLNIFYTAIASLAAFLLWRNMDNSVPIVSIQIVCAVLYLANVFLTAKGHLDKVRVATIYIFEVQMFLIMLLTNVWGSKVIFVVILYPLLAALVEESRVKHLVNGLLQVFVLLGAHFFLPTAERRLLELSTLAPEKAEVVAIMSLVFFPIMAAVIIEIFFRENVRAREKQRMMLAEISQTNKQLEVYAERLKDESMRLQAEVNIARKIQTMVLPSPEETAALDDLDVSCIMRTADEVGGDYYDVIRIGETTTIGIGDVTGHGLSSGIIMLMAQTVIRTLAELNIKDQRLFLSLVNKVLYANIKRIHEDRNMTLAIVTYSRGKCVAAGQHESIIVQRADGRTEVIDTIDMGIYVGLMEDVEKHVRTRSFDLGSGDVMILYSDGVTEAMDPAGRQFGLERLCDSVKANHALPAEKIQGKVMRDVYNFMGETVLQDDVSLVVVKRK